MGQFKEEILFSNYQIRNTKAHVSDWIDCRLMENKTILIRNELNQAITVYVQGARDKPATNIWEIDSFTVAANGGEEFGTLTDFFPFVRIAARCSSSPTSGGLNSYLEMSGV